MLLYDLVGRYEDIYFSPNTMRTKLVLKHLRIPFTVRPVTFANMQSVLSSILPLHLHPRVPTILDNNEPITDSWNIALHLDSVHTSQPLLFPSPAARSYSRFMQHYIDAVLHPAITKAVLHYYDTNLLDDESADLLSSQVQKAADIDTKNEAKQAFQTLEPIRRQIAECAKEGHAYFGGIKVTYTDYLIFSELWWPYCIAPLEFAIIMGAPSTDEEPKDDASKKLYDWFHRMLDLHDGYVRSLKTMRSTVQNGH